LLLGFAKEALRLLPVNFSSIRLSLRRRSLGVGQLVSNGSHFDLMLLFGGASCLIHQPITTVPVEVREEFKNDNDKK
jgi:hypothetical protein